MMLNRTDNQSCSRGGNNGGWYPSKHSKGDLPEAELIKELWVYSITALMTLTQKLRIRDSKELKLILGQGLISNPDLKIAANLPPLPLSVVQGM